MRRSRQIKPENIETFSRKAHEYVGQISDHAAKRFTLRYIEYLQAKAHGMTTTEPAGECGVSMLDCRLIRSVLRGIYKESFSKESEAA
jgi:hypothetical protein